MPINSVIEPVNRLTSSHTDRNTHTPAYKETSVLMTLLPERSKDSKSPIPRGNFRNGRRTPQSGVEIERKWARADYLMPGTASADKLVQITSTTV